MKYKVAKFGGSSVANAEQIAKVADIIGPDSSRKYVVVSAPGNVNGSSEPKVTDMLIDLADGRRKALEGVLGRYEQITTQLGIERTVSHQLREDLKKRLSYEGENQLKFSDRIKAFGEEANARIIAAYLNKKGISAEYVDPKGIGFLVTEEFGNAKLLESSNRNIRKRLKSRKGVTVFPGFFGYTKKGDIATFSRGGSDLTGAVLAAALNADVYENWTDVDGIYRADPNVVDKPELIKSVTYDEVRELSYMGFNVFHSVAMFPLKKANIETHLRNTNDPSKDGTHIYTARRTGSEVIAGVSSKKGFCTVDIRKPMMNEEVGFMRKALQWFEEQDISIEHVPSGIDSISVIFSQDQLKEDTLHKIKGGLCNKLGVERSSFRARENQAMVITVGQGMIHKPGVAQRITGACAKRGINIEMINQGSSELNVTIGVKDQEADPAVRAIYNEFVGKP